MDKKNNGPSEVVNDGNQYFDDPIADKESSIADQISSILDKDKPIRHKVFRKLHLLTRERLHRVGIETQEDEQNARSLAVWQDSIPASNEAEKQKALAAVKVEINLLFHEIKENEHRAGKLMRNALIQARNIGCRLIEVKERLLVVPGKKSSHGKYTAWVANNFDGGESTARVYKQIAEGWPRIEREVYRRFGKNPLTIEQARARLRERPAKKELDPASELLKQLVSLLRLSIVEKEWPTHAKRRLVLHGGEFMIAMEKAAKKLNNQIVVGLREEARRKNAKPSTNAT